MTKMECFIKKSRRGYDRVIDDLETLFVAIFFLIGILLPIIIISSVVFLVPLNSYVAVGLIVLSGIITYVWCRCIYFPLIECYYL